MILCKPVGLKNNTAKLNVLNVKQLIQYNTETFIFKGTILCWILPPSVCMGEVPSLTGGVPMPNFFLIWTYLVLVVESLGPTHVQLILISLTWCFCQITFFMILSYCTHLPCCSESVASFLQLHSSHIASHAYT